MEPFQVPPLPGDDLIEPDNFELYALGKLEGEARPAAPDDAGTEPTHTDVDCLEGMAPERLAVHGPWGHARNVELK